MRTVEHLMSALHGFGITNLLVKTDDEVPALDGSAAEFCRQIAEAGVQEQEATVEPIRIREPIVIGQRSEGQEYIPHRTRRASDHRLHAGLSRADRRAARALRADFAEAYVREIAPARTFGFVREFRKMDEMGLASGGRLDNVILVDDEKVVNTKLRFPDEFARHKVLDLIGDLYLLGRPLLGHVTASKTGHSDNLAMVKAVQSLL